MWEFLVWSDLVRAHTCTNCLQIPQVEQIWTYLNWIIAHCSAPMVSDISIFIPPFLKDSTEHINISILGGGQCLLWYSKGLIPPKPFTTATVLLLPENPKPPTSHWHLLHRNSGQQRESRNCSESDW